MGELALPLASFGTLLIWPSPSLYKAVLENWPLWHGYGRAGPDGMSCEHGKAGLTTCQPAAAARRASPALLLGPSGELALVQVQESRRANLLSYHPSSDPGLLSWHTPASTPSKSCWSVGRVWPCRSKAAGSPRHRAPTGYLRGVLESIWIQH